MASVRMSSTTGHAVGVAKNEPSGSRRLWLAAVGAVRAAQRAPSSILCLVSPPLLSIDGNLIAFHVGNNRLLSSELKCARPFPLPGGQVSDGMIRSWLGTNRWREGQDDG